METYMESLKTLLDCFGLTYMKVVTNEGVEIRVTFDDGQLFFYFNARGGINRDKRPAFLKYKN